MAFFYGMWENLTFGRYLRFLLDFVKDNSGIIAFIIFIYAIIVFLGRYGGGKYIPEKFEEYVILKANELAKDNGINGKNLIESIYNGWKEETEKFPSYIFIKSRRDYWIEKPTVENMEERLNINKDSVKEILIKNGVVKNEQ